MCSLESVLHALRAIRAPRCTSEYDLHALVGEALARAGIPVRHEAPLAPRRRIDFLCGTIGVEVKRGRPMPGTLTRQLTAYAQCEAISALVLVAERSPAIGPVLAGKPVHVVSLQRLWGIAL